MSVTQIYNLRTTCIIIESHVISSMVEIPVWIMRTNIKFTNIKDITLYANNVTSLKQENITHKYLISSKVLTPEANH